MSSSASSTFSGLYLELGDSYTKYLLRLHTVSLQVPNSIVQASICCFPSSRNYSCCELCKDYLSFFTSMSIFSSHSLWWQRPAQWSPVWNWFFRHQVRYDLSLSPPTCFSNFWYHGSFGSTNEAAVASLCPQALVLLHLQRCFQQSSFRHYLKLAQLLVCSGFLLSTTCIWVGLLASSSAKNLLLSKKDSSPGALWIGLREVLVVATFLCCTCALHKILSNEMTTEEVFVPL